MRDETPESRASIWHGGLTLGRPSTVEDASLRGQKYIHQPYELYSNENHETWRKLFARMVPRWQRYACDAFLQGIGILSIDPGRVPRFSELDSFVSALSGLRARPVSGVLSAPDFFDCLASREVPTTVLSLIHI